jgi:LysM repeat protein
VLAAHRFSPGTLDGKFGVDTQTAVYRFQVRAGLPPDGIAGPLTIARLCPTTACDSLPRSLLGTQAYHRVRRGDTLSALAERFGTTVAELEQANGLGGDLITIGQRLRIPAFGAEAAWPDEHVAATRVRDLLGRYAQRAGVSPSLARAVAWMESGFQPNVRSSAGAWGVMQVLPETWDYAELALLGGPVRHDTAGNIRVGTAYLAELLRRYDGNVRLALAAYYQGPEALRRWGVLPSSEHYATTILALESRNFP